MSETESNYIIIVLENCEGITLQEEDILTFALDDISSRLQDFYKLTIAKSTSIMISPDWCKSHPKECQRLTEWHDITAFEVHTGNREEYIFVDYQEEEGMEYTLGAENINESHYCYDDGGLFIMIDPKVGRGEITAESYINSLNV